MPVISSLEKRELFLNPALGGPAADYSPASRRAAGQSGPIYHMQPEEGGGEVAGGSRKWCDQYLKEGAH